MNRRVWATGAALAAAVAAYAAYNWTPFDFTTASDVIRDRQALIRWLPFASFTEASPLDTFGEAALKLLLAVPIGLFGYAVLPAPLRLYGRLATLVLVAAGLVFFAGVEAGQLALPSRYPDLTDVLLATGGLAAGILGMRLLER